MREQLVRDLAMLVVRLSLQVERIDPRNVVAAKARDFLKRNGLFEHFSVTRDNEQQQATE